ncbi:MAG TPA: undecaprenyldiphospho-muramoylpentapeptide beta-N-acetylglucosaminyltransferase [Flavobacteriales bacterium]|nr:undecaprenyldiphospho-muramoylpentapeptide beta-N-acetylglucosaminyltransferase [Flavobacteriales bacterium]
MKRIIISGGGTGGHIFPAISIANKLVETVEGVDILFVGAKDRMEMERVPAAGYPIEGLWISGFQRSLSLRNLSFPFKVIASMFRANRIINSFNPDLVIGVGGYASGPMLHAAASKGIPTMIQEQNSYAGVTNKLLGRKVDTICVAFDGMGKFFPKDKIVLTGNPIRKDILNLQHSAEDARKQLGLENKKTLLAMGGSLGARSINMGIRSGAKEMVDAGIQIIWQTGTAFFDEAVQFVQHEKLADEIKVFDFIADMDKAYSAADTIVSRAGAIAISEICCVGKPSILVPSPYVAEDHQTKNAKALSDNDAALLVIDGESNRLGQVINELFDDPMRMEQLSKNVAALAQRDAAKKIVAEAIKRFVSWGWGNWYERPGEVL